MCSIKKILNRTENRQYPLPELKWKYYQEWHQTVFFHWELPVYFLEEYIPQGLILDTYINMAWVSLAAFQVKNMRHRNLPSLPYLSNFEEINIRTYVTRNGIPGIYLFSIETNKFIEVFLTRIVIGLPYEKATIRRHRNQLYSENKKQKHLLDIKTGKSKILKNKTELDVWLTERHSLYEICANKICRFDIHHQEWRLRDMEITINDIGYKAGKYTINTYPDKIHYATKTQVLLCPKKET